MVFMKNVSLNHSQHQPSCHPERSEGSAQTFPPSSMPQIITACGLIMTMEVQAAVICP